MYYTFYYVSALDGCPTIYIYMYTFIFIFDMIYLYAPPAFIAIQTGDAYSLLPGASLFRGGKLIVRIPKKMEIGPVNDQHHSRGTLKVWFKVIRHVFGFGIEFLENKDIGMFGHCNVIDFIKWYSYHTYFTPISTSWFRRFGTGCIARNGEWSVYLWIIPYSQHCFLWNFVLYSRKAYLAHQYKKMLYDPYSYRITIDENPIPLQRICVLSYLCLLLTKVQFETSFKSFQYNTEGRRLSNYSIKLILCSLYRSKCKGLCQNSHFCAAHMALSVPNVLSCRLNILTEGAVLCKSGVERSGRRMGDCCRLWWIEVYTATRKHINRDLKEVNASYSTIDKNRYLNSLSL